MSLETVDREKADVARAVLVGVQHPEMTAREASTLLEELGELVTNLRIEILDTILVRIREPSATFLIGTGKAGEILEHARELGATHVVFDEALSPAQQRNWEAAAVKRQHKLDVTDRQEIILDVFADRARTREAVLQVELAQLEYYLPRLKRAWTHLSRQRGGGTGARGQGETQLEVDRRFVKDRITRVREELDGVVKQRAQQRRKRQRNAVPTAAIVGYTNAGKSTLLNALTGAGVLAEDKLFATLDPTTRQLMLPAHQKVLLSDTVGFIRRLPTRLVDAFKATLEEVVLADFLIHVLDVSSPEVEHHEATTIQVLGEIGAADKPILTVFNKVDALARDPQAPAQQDAASAALAESIDLAVLRARHPGAVFISCRSGEGMPALLEAIARAVDAATATGAFLIPHSRYELVAKLHQLGCVRASEQRDDGVWVDAVIPPSLAGQLAVFRSDV